MKLLHQQRSNKCSRQGFSLVELLVAMAITLVVVGAAVMMFMKSMDTNDVTTQMADMQANARAAANSISLDLSQAGTRIPWAGVVLPNGSGATQETFATSANYLSPRVFYQNPSTSVTTMYGVTPDRGAGPTIPPGGADTMDGITMVFADPVLSDTSKSNWSTTFVSSISTSGGTTTITMPSTLKPAINDPNTGLQIGDVLMVNNNTGQAVGTITGISGSVITLGPGDPFNFNQFNTSYAGNIPSLGVIAGGSVTYPGASSSMTIMPLNVITYFLQALGGTPPTPLALPAAGATDYRLMRQLNGQAPTIVAEHIDYLQFFYDLGDPSCTTVALSHIPDAQEPACGSNPAHPAYGLIRTVYVNIAARSERPDKRGQYNHATINTAVGPRSLAFRNTYPPTGP